MRVVMIRPLVFLMVTATVWIPGVGAAQELRSDPCGESGVLPVEDVITFPSEEYRSLQSAACGLADGGTLRLRSGTYEESFEIWGKHVRIEGFGNAKHWPTIQLPVPTVVASEPDGVITLGDAGSVELRKVHIVGGDAGILGLPGAGSVDVNQAGIAKSGRGILHLSSSALTLKHTVVEDTLWNGISYAPIDPPEVCGGVDISHGVFDVTGGAGIYLRGCTHEIAHTAFLFNEGGGIVAISSLLSVRHVDVAFADGWGVLLVNTAASLGHMNIDHTDSASLPSGAKFGGDAISVWTVDEPWAAAGPQRSFAWVEHVETFSSERVAVANIGSFVEIKDSEFSFQGFDFHADAHAGFPAEFERSGKVECYPAPVDCVAHGLGVTAPPPVGGQE